MELCDGILKYFSKNKWKNRYNYDNKITIQLNEVVKFMENQKQKIF